MLEEWRGRLGRRHAHAGAADRGAVRRVDVRDRLPIGTPEILKSVPASAAARLLSRPLSPRADGGDRRRRHRSRPRSRRLIRKHFGAMRAAPRRRAGGLSDSAASGHALRLASRIAEQTASSVSMLIKRPLETLRDRRRLSALADAVAGLRDAQRRASPRSPGRPTRRSSPRRSGDDTLGRTVEAASVSARVPDGRIPQGLSGLAQEIARVRQHGFGAAELERAKRAMLAALRARVQRARQGGEPRARRRAGPPLSSTSEAAPGIETRARRWCGSSCRRSPPRMWRRWLARCSPTPTASSSPRRPRRPGLAAVTEAALRDALRTGTTAVGHAMARRDGRARTAAEEAGAGRCAQAAARFRRSASPC